MFTKVNSVEEVTDEMLLNAQHQVIIHQALQITNLLEKLIVNEDLTRQFYMQCARNNITVTRDEKNKIKLTRI